MTTLAGQIRPGRIVLKTRQYAKVVAWYNIVLQARVIQASPTASWLIWGSEASQLVVLHMPQLANHDWSTAGVVHWGIVCDDELALLKQWQRLAGEGIHPYWSVDHGYCLSIHYRDPDGMQIELQAPRAGDITALTEAILAQKEDIEFDPAERVQVLGLGK
jgi:catechol-2,3-dioxygenase